MSRNYFLITSLLHSKNASQIETHECNFVEQSQFKFIVWNWVARVMLCYCSLHCDLGPFKYIRITLKISEIQLLQTECHNIDEAPLANCILSGGVAALV